MNLQEMKVPELKEKAKALSIEGADAMKKADLIEAIEKAQPKGFIEKAKDAVNNLLHPDQKPEVDEKPNQEMPAAPEKFDKESSQELSDLAKHPKFAKFKNTRGVK